MASKGNKGLSGRGAPHPGEVLRKMLDELGVSQTTIRPRARTVALDATPVPYRAKRQLFKSAKVKAGTRAETVVRRDRDGRD